MIYEAMNAVKQEIDGMGLYAPINIGSLLPGESLAMYAGPGGSEDEDLLRGNYGDVFLVVLAKSKASDACLQALEAIGKVMSAPKRAYAVGADWLINTIDVSAPPAYNSIEDDGRVIWTTTLRMNIEAK